MSSYAAQHIEEPLAGTVDMSDADSRFLASWKQRHANASRDRRRFEPVWQLCQSFIQNRQWVGWDIHDRRLIDLPNPDDRERVTVNVLTQYVQTIHGKLTADDFKPDVTFRKEDVEGIAFARQAQRALEYAWDEELEADEATLDALLKMCVFGTAGLRLKADPSYGPVVGEFPVGPDGQPIFDPRAKHEFMAAQVEQGTQAKLRQFREGRLCWEPLSPFHLLVPPGIENAKNFPWLIIDRPVSIETLRQTYGDAAVEGVTEEKLRAIDMIGHRETPGAETGPSTMSGELRGHVMLKTGFELGTVDAPLGRTVVWAGSKILNRQERLPFIVKGTGRIGWVPLHYHKVPGRFWGIGVVEPGIGAQKQRNRSRSQWIEMKDRAGLGRVFAHKGVITEVNKPKGGVFEVVNILPGHELPKETQGVPPGPWLAQDVQMNDDDLDKVMGLREVSLGQAPQGVSAYSAFAHLSEQDDKRIGPVLKLIRLQIAALVKITIVGMREYWQPDKQIAVAGESELMDAFLFNAAKLPEDCYVKVGKGAPLPQSPAALAQLSLDIFDRAIASGQVLPIDWLFESITGGRPQPLPKREMAVQEKVADLENHMILGGQMPQVAPFDNDELHVRRHTMAQEQWRMIPGMEQQVQAAEIHKQMHLQNASMKAMQQTQGQPTNPGGTPAKQPEGNGRDAGMGQQMGAAGGMGMIGPGGGGDAAVPMQ